MKLLQCIKDLEKEKAVKEYKPEINVAMIFTHDENNAIGIFPYSSEGNNVQFVEYLAQGFLKECEILLMYQALDEIKGNNSKLYEECLKVLQERHYEHYDEVVFRLEPKDSEDEEVS